MRAVVTGTIGTYPVGGVAWDYGQYVLGLERLGFEVYYLEDTGMLTYDPARRTYGDDCSYGVRFLRDALTELSPTLADRWHYRSTEGETYGVDRAELARIVAGADLFLNVSGACLLRDEYMECPLKVLIDTDPGWNHFAEFPRWDAKPGWQGTHGFRAHDRFFTYAVRIGQADCLLPDLGLSWRPTRPLVVPDRWPMAPPGDRWTTVLTWDNYGKPIHHGGREYGSKALEFERIETLPSHTPLTLEIAAGGVAPPVERMRELGWSVVDSTTVSLTPGLYVDYVVGSRGEFSVAKNVYVATRSGWFSCRSVCYLAAGRPVVVQDTGWSESVPHGDGLLAFTDLESAIAALEDAEAHYPRHREAARDLACTYFDSSTVLEEMLAEIGLA